MQTLQKIKKEKRQKLVVQVGIISFCIFLATLVFTLFSDYQITRNAYLSSKNEMIDRDLNTLRTTMTGIRILPWALRYWRENPKETVRAYSEEDEKIDESTEFQDLYSACLLGEKDPAKEDPAIQRLIASRVFTGFGLDLKNKRGMDYARIFLLGIMNEEESIRYLDNTTYSTQTGGNTLIYYPTSEHSAVKKILRDGVTDFDKTIYELYHDPTSGKEYYIGYIPVCLSEGERCFLCICYDWSDFYNQLLSNARNSMIAGLIVLILLNGLLTLFIYRKTILPVLKMKSGVEDYMADKDSHAVSEKMDQIRVQNEIGVLADSFSDLATEIDRYTKEILTLNTEKARIQTELSLATNIQSSMLPSDFPAFPDRTDFDIHASMNPAKEVGGDFYDFFLIDDDHLCLVIADVSGKGVPAALFMMSSMITLRNLAEQGTSPAAILESANKAICASNKQEMFVTVWLGILELSTGKLTAANAGHEYPVFCGESGRFELFKDRHGFVVGGMEGICYREYEVLLTPGSKLFVYTDGVPEATNAEGEMYGTDRMVDALNNAVGSVNSAGSVNSVGSADSTPKDILAAVRASVDEFVKDAEQFDDLTMLCLSYHGQRGSR